MPSRAMLLVGTGGVGETVLLNELEDAAKEAGRQVGEIAKRLGKGSDVVSHYARKLMVKHIIFAPGRGHYGFTIPGMREYFRLGQITYAGPNFW